MRTIVCLTVVACLTGTAAAQRGGSNSSLPRVGSSLPDVTVYDDRGREFPMTQLRGDYSVLVFGCLT